MDDDWWKLLNDNLAINDTNDLICECGNNFTLFENRKICEICCIQDDFVSTGPAKEFVTYSRGGTVSCRAKQEPDRAKFIKQIYHMILRTDPTISISDEHLDEAVKYVIENQKMSSGNRGCRLYSTLVGALIYVFRNTGVSYSEQKYAKIFSTRFGISGGWNSITTAQALKSFQKGESTPLCIVESSNVMRERIKEQMTSQGLNAADKNLYRFIKTMTELMHLFGYIDNQISAGKIAASIYFYLRYFDPQKRITTLAEMNQTMETKPDTTNKYVIKLYAARETIQILAKQLYDIEQQRPF